MDARVHQLKNLLYEQLTLIHGVRMPLQLTELIDDLIQAKIDLEVQRLKQQLDQVFFPPETRG